eukprot:TRINITY_DN1444_c0_g1_i1.p1 TRINITY_DN1444_c0_g1~~TRINITY_DN1444_c0_g1_i1.p1  ORF type:complete len:153 (+),score=59.26 TRINITY_DN1444_c0_g1_i1:83-541(+)
MGSEQSALTRSKSRDGGGTRSSPSHLRQGSVSSEVEVPSYVPYTVGRPIGSESSPKKAPPTSPPSHKPKERRRRPWVDSGTMITLNGSSSSSSGGSRSRSKDARDMEEEDDSEEIKALEGISSFLPIMRGSSRDPDILERAERVLLLFFWWE